MHREQGEGPLEAGDDRAERGDEVSAVRGIGAAEQHGGDLGVGLAPERMPVEFGAELAEVLDDPVVDDGELVVVGQMRMRVLVGGTAVGRPSGVADARGAVGHRVPDEVVSQHLQLAGALAHVERTGAVDHGDAGGVVSAVLQSRQACQEDGLALPRAHVSDDSTHGLHRNLRRLAPRPVPNAAGGTRRVRAIGDASCVEST